MARQTDEEPSNQGEDDHVARFRHVPAHFPLMAMSPMALTVTDAGSSFVVPADGANAKRAGSVGGAVFHLFNSNVNCGALVNHFVVKTYLTGSGLSPTVTHNCQSTSLTRKGSCCTSDP